MVENGRNETGNTVYDYGRTYRLPNYGNMMELDSVTNDLHTDDLYPNRQHMTNRTIELLLWDKLEIETWKINGVLTAIQSMVYDFFE